MERSIRKSFGRYLREQAGDSYQRRPFDQLVPESFYPIGWSRDGNFAYYVEPFDEACGCYFAKLFILNLKTDEVLWSFDYSSEGTEGLYGIIGKATLQLNSSRRGKKTVVDHSYSEARPLHVGLLGYVKSQFEPRIAVVLMKVMRGWEGPPHTGDVQIVGASLDDGFKKF